jgi:succinyl-CoA synthetase beta subunit
MLGLTINGLPVRKLFVCPAITAVSESYLSLLIDRGHAKMTFIGCANGGVEIEETAKTSPEKILRLAVRVSEAGHLSRETCRTFAQYLFRDKGQAEAAIEIMIAMAKLFLARDCSLVEINPLVVDSRGKVLALDGKVQFDDNALFRHEENEQLRDMDAEDREELEAKAAGLSFVRLDGDIGCMVNGAGLAMATMDIIKHFGGKPANFLDVGGSSNPNKIVAAFRMILRDKRVKIIFINIFGGITRCDDVARGILAAREQLTMDVPIIIRLVGTNEAKARELLGETDMKVALTLEEGAQLASKWVQAI